MRRVLLAALLLAAACGTDAAQERTLACPGDEAEVVEALGSGLPTYDYEPATDLEALVERVDVVIRASLTSAVRESGSTVMSLNDVDVLVGTPGQPVDAVTTTSQWVVRGETDPLGALVTIDGLSVLAFLTEHPRSATGFVADVQGIHVTCDANLGRLRPVIEPLPTEAQGAPLRTLVATLEAG